MAKKKRTTTGSKNGRASLTREIFFEKAKPKIEEVEVEGYGRVSIRSIGRVQMARRMFQYSKADGTPILAAMEKADVHSIIDQIYTTAGEPMFRESDVELLGDLDGLQLDPLLEAITNFNDRNPDPEGK